MTSKLAELCRPLGDLSLEMLDAARDDLAGRPGRRLEFPVISSTWLDIGEAGIGELCDGIPEAVADWAWENYGVGPAPPPRRRDE